MLRDANEEVSFSRQGGAPEAALIGWATQFIKHDETFVDVGAHVGEWAQHFALKCKQVHAFEPQRAVFSRLQLGASMAKLRNVTCHNVALSAGSDEAELHVLPDGRSTLRHRQELDAAVAVERVRGAQLDDFEFENLGCIKIAAGGCSLDVLRGAV